MIKKRLINNAEKRQIYAFLGFILSKDRDGSSEWLARNFRSKIINEQCFLMPDWSKLSKKVRIGNFKTKDALKKALIKKGRKIFASPISFQDTEMKSVNVVALWEDGKETIEVVRPSYSKHFGLDLNGRHEEATYLRWARLLGLEPCPSETSMQMLLQDTIVDMNALIVANSYPRFRTTSMGNDDRGLEVDDFMIFGQNPGLVTSLVYKVRKPQPLQDDVPDSIKNAGWAGDLICRPVGHLDSPIDEGRIPVLKDDVKAFKKRLSKKEYSEHEIICIRLSLEDICSSHMPFIGNWVEWRDLKIGSFKTTDQLKAALFDKEIGYVKQSSDQLAHPEQMLARCPLHPEETVIPLVLVNPYELGFSSDSGGGWGGEISKVEFYEWARRFGLYRCPPETAPQLCLQLNEENWPKRSIRGISKLVVSTPRGIRNNSEEYTDTRFIIKKTEDGKIVLDGNNDYLSLEPSDTVVFTTIDFGYSYE